MGLANAGAALVGQNLGAGKPQRAEDAVKIATRYNTLFLGIVGVVFVVFAHSIVSLFTHDPIVLAHGTRALWVVAVALPIYAAGMCLGAAFNGAGDTWTPTRLNLFCFWLLQVPLAWVLAQPLNFGPTGVFVAIPLSFSVLALWTAVLFKQGRWKQQQI
jgi:Na+-driven multidrug efflux pump